MSEQEEVLSQDEIDALLDGVEDGDVNTGDDGSGGSNITEWDFGNRDYLTRAQYPALQVVNERFVRFARNSLYNMFRRPVEISIRDIRIQSFKEYKDSLYSPTSFTMLRSSSLRGTAMAVMEPALVYRLVDSFFGGQGRGFTGSEDREFTNTEIRVIKLAMDTMLKDFNEAWTPVTSVEFKIRSHEVNPQMAKISGPDDLVVVCGFNVELSETGGDIQFVMPYSMLEPIKDKLEAKADSGNDARDERFSVRLHQEAMGALVELVCTLPARSINLRQIADLQAGDVLMIDQPDEVSLSIEGVTCLKGSLGRSREYMAFQTTRSMSLEQASGEENIKHLAHKN